MISERLFQTVCWVLLHSLWQGLLLALLTGLTMVLSKKASAAARYNLLCSLLLLFVSVVAATSYYEWQSAAINHFATPLTPAINQLNHAGSGLNQDQAVQTATSPLIKFFHQFSAYFNEHASLIVTIWFVLFMAKCISILSGLVQVQRIKHYRTTTVSEAWLEKLRLLARRLEVTTPIQMLESAIIRVPLVIGWLKPTILLPLGLLTRLSPQEVESILLHELAHIRRRDYLVNLLQSFVDTVFFFNPAIVWISSLIRAERENCCDDMAIQESGSKKQFISALVSFHQYDASSRGLSIGFAGRKNSLVDRVRRIANSRNKSLNQKEKGLLLFSFLVLGIFLVAFSSNPAGPVSKQKEMPASTEKIQPAKQKSPSATTGSAKKITHNTSDAKSEAKKRELVKAVKPVQDMNTRPLDIHVVVKNSHEDNPVSAETTLAQLGYQQVDPDMQIKLRDHGVDADYIGELIAQGYRNISLEKLLEFKDHGVTGEYLSGMKSLGYSALSLEEAREMIDHGVNPALIRRWAAAGYPGIALNLVKELTDHGVTPGFLQSIKALGFDKVSLEAAMNYKDHGVTPGMIENMRALGYTAISLQQAQNLVDHGVTSGFIEKMKKKTGSDHTLEEYIALKDALN